MESPERVMRLCDSRWELCAHLQAQNIPQSLKFDGKTAGLKENGCVIAAIALVVIGRISPGSEWITVLIWPGDSELCKNRSSTRLRGHESYKHGIYQRYPSSPSSPAYLTLVLAPALAPIRAQVEREGPQMRCYIYRQTVRGTEAAQGLTCHHWKKGLQSQPQQGPDLQPRR